MKRLTIVAALFVTALSIPSARAEKLDGTFTATAVCPALQSIRNGTNPGGIETEIGRAYQVIEINKVGGDHLRMRIPDAPVLAERWVRIDCGDFVAADGTASSPTGPVAGGTGGTGGTSARHVLAVSWQPAFCETKTGATECKLLNDGGLPSTETGFTIHGLWPQSGNYCGPLGSAHQNTQGWENLPAPDLSDDTRAALDALMPGTMSHLHHHEWIKHGTCYPDAGGAEEYYADTIQLVRELNASPFAAFIAGKRGETITGEELRAMFDDAFGADAGKRVRIKCVQDGSRTLISELQIRLQGEVTPEAELSALILAAPLAKAGCKGGEIDEAGLQG